MVQYQAGDYIEYAIETTDGGFFDIGMYTVIFILMVLLLPMHHLKFYSILHEFNLAGGINY